MAEIQIVSLSEIGEIITGNTPKTSDLENYESNDIPFLKPSDFSTDSIDLFKTEFFISEKARNKARILPVGSVAVTCIGIIGKTKITQKECAFNQQINAIIPYKDNYNRYIAYAIAFQKELLQTQANAAVVPIINKTEFSKISIPFPPFETQKQIAANLDKVTHTIDLCNTILEKLDLLVKARFVEMFGDIETNSNNYPVHKLNDLCNVSSSKRIYQEEQSSSGVPFLRISNLVALIDNNSFESELFIPEEKYCELLENDLVPKVNDILVTSRGTLGKCYIMQEHDKFYFQDGMISWLYNIDKTITPLYLTLLFDTKGIKRQIENLQSGSTVAYLSIAMLKKLNIVVPPLDLQNQFAAFVEQTDKSKSAVKKVLEKAEILKKALMQEYFG